jgi:hypothetical protein
MKAAAPALATFGWRWATEPRGGTRKRQVDEAFGAK